MVQKDESIKETRAPSPGEERVIDNKCTPISLTNQAQTYIRADGMGRMLDYVLIPDHKKRPQFLVRARVELAGKQMPVRFDVNKRIIYVYAIGKYARLMSISAKGDMFHFISMDYVYACPPEMETDFRRSGWFASRLRNITLDSKRWHFSRQGKKQLQIADLEAEIGDKDTFNMEHF